MSESGIRNFSIIAHIDHGKSTLADRLLEFTGALEVREKRDQVLDDMDLERERGITIKARAVRLQYTDSKKKEYIFNLIDTPGHVDFTYEVSRSLAACEGALLVVDATQGVEAQTIANAYLAIENNLSIIPVINKIDLPSADVEKVKLQIQDILGLDSEMALLTSAKEGRGVHEILESIVTRIPPPSNDIQKPLKALIFDSWFDNYQGAVIVTRIIDGKIQVGQKIRLMSAKRDYDVLSLGIFTPKREAVSKLSAGEVGYIIAGIKRVGDTKIGDTITDAYHPTATPFPGYKEIKPMVFCGFYTIESGQYSELREALEKLHLNDSSFTYETETSLALGFGYRCGFLGLLHKEIIQERLEREYHLSLIGTAPTVVYRVIDRNGEEHFVDNPSKLPEAQFIEKMDEPYILATLITPETFLGLILKLCQDRRGIQRDLKYLDRDRVMVVYELPLNEVILDFFDRLKSLSKGYASFDYEWLEYREGNLVKVDILLNGETLDSLSFIVNREKAYYRGRQLTEKMREVIPRQLFDVVIQAAIGGRIIARETVKALKKNVTAKCYGGDITRKRKLWEKQKEGKKKMKQVGRVEIPQEAFLVVLKVKD